MDSVVSEGCSRKIQSIIAMTTTAFWSVPLENWVALATVIRTHPMKTTRVEKGLCPWTQPSCLYA